MKNNENRYILLKYLLRLTLENGMGSQREKKLSEINLSINLKLEIGEINMLKAEYNFFHLRNQKGYHLSEND